MVGADVGAADGSSVGVDVGYVITAASFAADWVALASAGSDASVRSVCVLAEPLRIATAATARKARPAKTLAATSSGRRRGGAATSASSGICLYMGLQARDGVL